MQRSSSVSYKGKHILVTGGSEGMGKSVASEMFKLGANVTIMARRQEVLDKTVEEIEKVRVNDSQKIVAQVSDVTKFEELHEIVKKIDSELPIDVLVNCAGRSSPGMFSDVPITDFNDMIQLNYLGQVNAVRAVLPGFIARNQGQIVFTTSTLALCVIPGYSAYAGAKFAVTGMAAALMYELKPYNIDISVCYPTTMDTPGLKIENESKPALTWEIEDSVESMNTDDVARSLIPQMAHKRYHITFDVFTWICRITDTPLLTPRNNVLLEFIMLPFLAVMNVAMIPVIMGKVKSYFKKNPASETTPLKTQE